ncbi:PDZ domain-containing protein, partial [Candidatus Falkowbacteria bacterium]|nr:PDZ domain-containing protein [Candidatus Falkowbacteria bacterium]
DYQNPLAGSPAGIIGIKKDDIILSVDGRQVEKSHSLTDLVQQYKPGDQINLEIMRLGQTLNLRAALSVLAN